MNCPSCGVKTEQLDWLDRNQRHTKRLAAYVARLCEMASCKAVSEWVDEDWKTVKRFDKQALLSKWKEPNLEGLRVLAIDEIALKKGHQYATVILDVKANVWYGWWKDAQKNLWSRFINCLDRSGVERLRRWQWICGNRL